MRGAHHTSIRTLTVAAILPIALATAVAGCGSGTNSSSGAGTTATAPNPEIPAASSYDPKIVPADFTTKIDNAYFPLTPGTLSVYSGLKDGVRQIHNTTVTRKTRVVMGVKTVVIEDVVTENGKLAEKASDWYVQDKKGNVWYFGEATADYSPTGVVTSTKGSWEAGVDGAKPGIVMQADPKVGPEYYQEFRPGIAEDKGKVLSLGKTLTIGKKTYTNVIQTLDRNPLDTSIVSNKWYAKGVGLIQTKRTGSSHKELSQLVRVTGI